MCAQGGITLKRLHAALDAKGLAMSNLGSISEQTLAGMVTTATHGTGINQRVLSSHVQMLRLLLADGSHVSCSPTERPDLFYGSLCGLGSTGLILRVQLHVVPSFLLRESQETFNFDPTLDNLDEIVHSAEYVRLWWWPQADAVRVSSMDKTSEVRTFLAFIHE